MVTKVRTIDFLPEIFRTDANKQFLNATLDQLVQQPNLTRVQGFVGRKFGKGVNPNDSYVPEIDKTRTDYQLEPGVVFLKPNTNDVRDFLTYPGLIDSLKTEGSILNNDSVRFANEFYSWDSFADLDKLINYSQYYWLPFGPDSVTIANSTVYDNIAYDVISEINSYVLQENKFPLVGSNPEITLLRGGTYTFNVDQSSKFWIQTSPGIEGIDANRNNISTRQVYGVENNGVNKGIITIKVPYSNAQDIEYSTSTFVDLATKLNFNDINGKLLSQVGDIDGITLLKGKTLLFYGHPYNATAEMNEFYDSTAFSPIDNNNFENTDITFLNQTIYKIELVSEDSSNPVVKLVKHDEIYFDQQLIIGSGKEFIGKKFAKNVVSTEIELVENKTAPLDTLYYQDSENPFMFGKINLIDDQFTNVIYVEDDIIGKKNYASPNGVVFTNGLKVIFDGEVSPSKYFGKEYYVEGVGTSISLIPVKELVIFEPFGKSLYAPYDYHPYDSVPYGSSLLHVPLDKDYITVNRNSNDRNAWSRSNRWFHADVLNETIKHTGSKTALAALGNAATRANRPIIEFYPNIKMFDTGIIGRGAVDFIDFVSTDALNQVAGTAAYSPNNQNVELFTGATIIFAADDDVNVRNKIYLVNVVRLSNSSQKTITLSEIPTGSAVENDQVFISTDLAYSGKSFRFDGSKWNQAQQKDYVNQPPKFDIFDKNGTSFGDNSYYRGTSFTGSTLFEYAIGSGPRDMILGFPIKYSDSSVIGDISFEVSLNNDVFTYADGLNSITTSVNTGYPYIYSDRNNYTRQLGWQTAVAESFQYQTFNTEYDPATGQNAEFYCGVVVKDQNTTMWPTVRVYLNDEILPASEYTVNVIEIPKSGYYTKITFNTNPTNKSEVQMLINTSQGKDDFAFYDIPNNLAKNPFNTPVTQLNLGDIRAHYETICNNVPYISGSVFGPNNYRDLGNLVPYGTNIIQNSAPLIMASAFLRNKDYNIFDALTYNSTEYVKFKNLLINTVDNTDYTVYQSSADMLDDALSQITAAKNQTNSFFYSDMLPSGSPFFTKSYSFNVVVTTATYQLSRIYDFNNANYYGVLVYLTRNIDGLMVTTQLVKGIDYDISSDEPKLTLHTHLKLKDVVTINEYNQTYGSYIPNTPSKLGLYPAYIPEVTYDDSYLYPTYFIKGHDGSLTKLYGEYDNGMLTDFRDRVLLEFETRIYNNLKISAKIPLTRDEIIPGYFRDTGYSFDEIQKIHSYGFLNWVGKNRIDYKTQYYSVSSPKTYNYVGSKTKWSDETVTQGNWRGIYNYFYDTCTPDKTPWEMLGFSIKPTWWEKRYGLAPYTSDNLVLWQDIENGIDYNDGNPRVLSSRVRPGLITILPVDSQGKLKEVTDTILASYDSWKINNNWKVGDVGPVEYSYLKSSSYPFELMRLYALAKPAKFFALSQDIDLYRYNEEFKQYLYDDRFRLGSRNIINYGSGKAQHSCVNWVVDYIQSTGMPGYDKITELLSNLDVRLIYRLAGFSDKNLLKLYIENSSVNSKNNSLMLPDESFSLVLYNNQPYNTLTYSGVIIQRTENGFKIYGNSQNTAYFKTANPSLDGAYQTITIEGLSVNLSRNYNLIENVIPYGTEFLSAQSLCEFILNYGRYLVSQGMIFESIENSTVLNWQQMINEILYWIQSGWEVGSTINLNPAASTLQVDKENNIVQPLTFQKQNYVLNQNLIPIQTKDLAITRDGTNFEVSPLNVGDTLSYFVANLSNFEHGIVLDNRSLFNDVVYNLVTGLRQLRIKIKGVKTAEWNGQLDAQGFILNQDNINEWQQNIKYPKGSIVTYKNSYWISNVLVQPTNAFDQTNWTKTNYEKIQKGLLPNPSNRAYESTLYYDVSATNLEHDADLLGYSLIGYRPKDYFASADFDDVTQVNVHQNLIAGKGTRNTIDALSGIMLPMGQISYDVYENWAIKINEYGGILNQNYIELKLDESVLTNNPNIISIVKDESVEGSTMEIPLYSITNYQRSIIDLNILPLKDNGVIDKLPSAGYVNFNDIKVHSFDFATLKNNIVPVSNLYQNDYVWIADINGTWQVYTPVTTNTENIKVAATTCKNNLNETVTIEFDNRHGLEKNDLIAIINFDTKVNGYYKVLSVPTLSSITLALTLPNTVLTINSIGLVSKFQSHRVSMPSEIANLDLNKFQYQKNKFWVDNSVNGNPVVYRKNLNYNQLPFENSETSSNFSSSILFDESFGYFVTDSGLGKLYRYTYNNVSKTFNLDATISQTTGYGTAMVKAGNILVVTKPDAVSSKIYVYSLLNIDKLTEVVQHQSITIASKRCGDAIAISGDKRYMYVSASGSQAEILAYKLDDVPAHTSSTILLDAKLNLGSYTISVTGNQLSKLKLGMTISFSNNTQDKTYHIISVIYNSSTNKTIIIIDQAITNDIPGNTPIYIVSYNYSSVGTLTVSGITTSDQFGYSISTNYDGSKVFVTAPQKDDQGTLTDVGSAYVFSRTKQVFKHKYNTLPDQTTSFTCVVNLVSPTVYQNGTLLLKDTDYTINSAILTILGSVKSGDIIEVQTNNFVLTQTILASDVISDLRLGTRFGNSIDNNVSGTEVLVGAPYNITSDNQEGTVHRFTNPGKKYGLITGTTSTTLVSPATILINGYSVALPNTGIDGIVAAINNANITNVIASKTVDNRLVMQLRNGDIAPVNDKLTITALDSSVFTALGITEYINTQTITNINIQGTSQFGSAVKFNEYDSFVVSAPTATRYAATTLDFSDDENNDNDTVFDNNFTKFIDGVSIAGEVYVYDYLPAYNESSVNIGKFVYAQSLNGISPNYTNQPLYGQKLAFNGYDVLIGSPNAKTSTENGSLVIFTNASKTPNWSIYRNLNNPVDIDRIQNISLYDNTNNDRLDILDYIDPVQGKLLGAVRENIDFMGSIDPAGYNANGLATSILWGENFVGKIWFNTSKTRFVDYYQNDIVYNSEYWGSVFPESAVTVYTWVESNFEPLFYDGEGTPYNAESFTISYKVNNLGALVPRYYYWVRNTNKVFTSVGKTLPDTILESYIRNPISSGIAFLAPIKPNVFALYNSSGFINHTYTSLHIGFSTGKNDDTIHNEYKLIRDGVAEDFLPGIPSTLTKWKSPESLYNKLLNSLSGVDDFGQILPDPYLPSLLRTGIASRPRQSLFNDRLTALKNYCQYANEVLAKFPLAETKTFTFLGSTTVSDYWEYVYWWANGYTNNTKPNVEVPKYFDLYSITPFIGMIARVASNSDGKKEVYEYDGSMWNRVGLEQGTIQIKQSLYTFGDFGFDSKFYDSDLYDSYPSYETKQILRALNEQIFIDELAIYRNKGLILLFECIQSETTEKQNYLPWLNKTSLVDVSHTLRELNQTAKFQQDEQELVEGYVNETKPYNVVIKEFSLRYTKTESYLSTATDFDTPPKYDPNTEKFKIPEMVFSNTLSKGQYTPKSSVWTDNSYSDWRSNFGLAMAGYRNYRIATLVAYVNNVDKTLVVDNAYGFPISGSLKIDDEIVSYTDVNRVTNTLFGVTRGVKNTNPVEHFSGTKIFIDLPGAVVLDAGRKYTSPPQITVYIDTTIYPKPRRTAQVKPILINGKVIAVDVIDSGEGYAVEPELIVQPSLVFTFDYKNINSIENTISIRSIEPLVTGDCVKYQVPSGVTPLASLLENKFYYVGVVQNSDFSYDQIFALYQNKHDATLDINRINLISLNNGVGHTLAITARIIAVMHNTPTRVLTPTLKFDRTSYRSKVIEWNPNEFYSAKFKSTTLASSTTKLKYASTFYNKSGIVVPSGGTEAEFTVYDMVMQGTYQVTISNVGIHYHVNDVITILGTSLGGTAPENNCVITVTQVSGIGQIERFIFSGTPASTQKASLQNAVLTVVGATSYKNTDNAAVTVDYTGSLISPGQLKGLPLYFYNIIAPYTWTGSAPGSASITVHRPNFGENGVYDQYVIRLNSAGSIYTSGDKITIDGALLGGLSGVNDLTINVVLAVSGAIKVYDHKGLAVGNFMQYYVYPVTGTELLLYRDSELKQPVTLTFWTANSGTYAYLPDPSMILTSHAFTPESIVTYDNKLYVAVANSNDKEFDYNKWEEISGEDPRLNALDRIMGFYQPTDNMPGKDLTQLLDGIIYPNNIYYGNKFSNSDILPIDTVITDQPFYPTNINIKSITFGKGKHVAIADSSKYSLTLTSDNTVDWKINKISDQVLGVQDIIYSGTYYIMTTSNVSTPVMISTDGVNWATVGPYTPYDLLPFDSLEFDRASVVAPPDKLYSVIYHKGKYIAVGNDILSSIDGNIWNQVYNDANEFYLKITSVAHINMPFFAGYAAISFGTDVLDTTTADTLINRSRLITSTDGSYWTRSNTPISENSLNSIFASEDLTITCGDNASIYYSSNCFNWDKGTIQTLPITANLLSGVYHSGVYVVVGENGTILNSYDGVNWNQRVSYTTQKLSKIIHNSGYFIAVGDNATVVTSSDSIVWKNVSNIIADDTFYEVKGDKFLTGYGPEELVAGIVYDNLSMRVTTSPSSNWDTNTYQHTGFVMKSITVKPKLVTNLVYSTLVRPNDYDLLIEDGDMYITENNENLTIDDYGIEDPTGTRVIVSFANVVTNPMQVAVYAVDATTLIGRRLYEGIDYTIDKGWIPKIITLNNALADNELCMIEVYEVGGGNQLVKSNTDQLPLLGNSNETNVWSEINLGYAYQATVYTTPICYHNGKKLEFNVDYFLKPSSAGETHLVFADIYDTVDDYLSFAVLGNSVTDSNATQFGYSIPETQIFAYTGSNAFTLVNNFDGTNILNSIVEVNGLRLVYGTDYSISGNVLTITASLNTNDVIAATSYNDTAQQYLNTQTVTSLKVTPIVYLDNTTTPLTIVTEVASGLTTGSKVRIDGLTGADQLNDNTYYVKASSPTVLELYLDANRRLPVTADFVNPYYSGGYVWKDSDTATISQPFDLTDPTRFFVSINGHKLDSKQLRLNTGNKLSILADIDTTDTVLITSMVSTSTPNELSYILNVDRTGAGTVYRSNNDTTTWLTVPLYETDTQIFVKDIMTLIEMTEFKSTAENDGTSIYTQVNIDIELIKDVKIYNQTTFTDLNPDNFTLGYKNYQTTIIFKNEVKEGDKLTIKLYLGNEIQINGERIQFRKVDVANNRLYQLMRGVKGTGKQKLIVVNTPVLSMLTVHQLSSYYYNRTWNTSIYDPSKGDPLQLSTSAPAKFLKIGS